MDVGVLAVGVLLFLVILAFLWANASRPLHSLEYQAVSAGITLASLILYYGLMN